MAKYVKPAMTKLGSLARLTGSSIPKYGTPTGDVIVYNNNDYPVPGSTTTS